MTTVDKPNKDVRALLRDGLREGLAGKPWPVECSYCGVGIDRRDAGECKDGPLCVVCTLHPRFDITVCPDCGAAWDDTMQPCACGLTVEAYEQRVREAVS